jgi:GntR family transcriptional regulator, sialic acid-inducible nan operon repressor
MMFKAIPRAKLFENVAKQLEEVILSGRLKGGDELPSEKELMTAFGVGRPAIRDALLVLQTEGLVIIQHGRRARVAARPEPSIVKRAEQILSAAYAETDQLIEDIKEARLALEVAMVRKAAMVATAEDLRRLREALERNRRAISSRDEFLASDIAFHRTIASITGNRIFEEASALVLEWLARFRTDMVHVEGANLVSYDEHAAIAKGIVERDPEQAAEAMRRHQLRTHAIYQALAPAPRPPPNAVGLG